MRIQVKTIEEWIDLAKRTDWSVSVLAEYCKLSVRTLHRHILKATGTSTKKWINSERYKEAIHLLRQGASVKEAADRVGYRHSTNFSRQHKHFCGKSPSSQRKYR